MEEEVWKYHRGSWSRMTAPVAFEDEDGEQLDAPEGYSPRTRWFGDDGEFEVEIYSADPEAEARPPNPYLVIIYNLGDNSERIFVEDFPSMLQLLKELAPIIDLPNRAWEPDEDASDDGAEYE